MHPLGRVKQIQRQTLLCAMRNTDILVLFMTCPYLRHGQTTIYGQARKYFTSVLHN